MVLSSFLTLLILGLLASAALAFASKIFFVEEDPKVEEVTEVLPGANCGGCGFAGCESYAAAVAHDPAVPANLCVAGGAATAEAVGRITGKAAGSADPVVSFRRCEKHAGNVLKRYTYQGIPSCAAAAELANGSEKCEYACLGFGDCVRACPFGALQLEGDIVTVNSDKCTGCGICTKNCPRAVLEIIPRRARVVIGCSTKNKLKVAMQLCDSGCINCGKCVKSCPAKAIDNSTGRIQIDQEKCLAYGSSCGEACLKACSRGSLRPFSINGKTA
ncbi:MAG: Fe-S cluster domain-containing protein [Desulfovibrionaceae bacterium]|nr:Fe-S cluster domain-containing protein [Desulfovibrionaceae bacterium]